MPITYILIVLITCEKDCYYDGCTKKVHEYIPNFDSWNYHLSRMYIVPILIRSVLLFYFNKLIVINYKNVTKIKLEGSRKHEL